MLLPWNRAPVLTAVRIPVLVLVFAAVACGSTGATDRTSAAGATHCRRTWADERQGLAENGNPGQPGSVLARRYGELSAVTDQMAEHADATDCPGALAAQKARFDAYFRIEFDARTHDMVTQLALAEADLKHAIATRDYDPLPVPLAHAFAVLRAQAPVADRQLRSGLDTAAGADLTLAGVRTAKQALATAAASSPAYRTCQQALRTIASYELDEE
jgi:hypothetical protein